MRRRDTRRTPDTSGATASTPERLVTLREAADRLTISRTTLWRLRDEIPHVQITPTRAAIRERDLVAFIDRRAGR